MDQGQDLGVLDGFGEETGHIDLLADHVGRGFVGDAGGDDDDRDLLVFILLEELEHLKTAQDGHHPVQDDQVHLFLIDRGHAVLAVVAEIDAEALQLEEGFQVDADGFIVVDDEDELVLGVGLVRHGNEACILMSRTPSM